MLRRKAERELKVQNEQLTAILSATPLGIFQVRNNLVAWTNRQFARMLGYEESHLIGKDIHIFFKTPEDFDLMCRELQFAKNSQGSPQGRMQVCKKRFRVSCMPGRSPDDRPAGYQPGRDFYCN